MTRTRVHELLLDGKKALGALATLETAALGYGLIDSRTAGLAAAGIGALTAAVVWLLDNEAAPEPDGQGSV